tara:strand:+ start:304 stop:1443 length:1140 start_codon:yes stop_codon:yes gene_type:complete
MSRILKRPMFRNGGRANSKGTGIMSGIEEREGFQSGGVGLAQSPFKKFVVDPALTMASPFVNVGADLGNLTKMFFGGEPTFQYLNPFAKGSGLGVTAQPASEFYKTGDSSPIIPEVQASEITDTKKEEDDTVGTVTDETTTVRDLAEGMEKGKLDEFSENIDTDDGLDELEQKLQSKADMFKKFLYGPEEKAQTGFRALTEAGLKALEGDIAGGIKAGSDTLAEGRKTAEAGKTLALKSFIQKDLQKDPTKQKEIEFLMSRGLTQDQAIEAVYGGSKGSDLLKAYSKERYLQDRTADYAKEDQPKIVRDNAVGYALADYIMIENDEVSRVPYKGNQIDTSLIQEGVVYFDPVRRSFMAVKDGDAQFFSTIEQTKTFLGS